jgi:NhaA family Na+:H+ antiporter
MNPHALEHHHVAAPWLPRLVSVRAVRFVFDRYLLLPMGAVVALLWANTDPERYFTFAHQLAFPVNEIGMALFLGLVTQEVVEAVMPGGALHTWRRWTVPLVAAVGGLLGASFAFFAYVYLKQEAVLLQGWPVAGVIDLAAGYYVLKSIFRGRSAFTFFLLSGIATNAVGIIVLAVRPALTPGHVFGAVLLVAAVALAATFRHRHVRTFWPYLIVCGTMSWLAFYWAGVHPALALVPIVPFLPHEPRRLEVFADAPDDDAVHHAEHAWTVVVQVVLFLFGLVNAGVILRGYDTGTWAVLLAALVGRPIGVMAIMAIAVGAGLRLPRLIGWRELVVIALATSSGFTFSLFVATSVIPVGAVLTQLKLGALSTVFGAAFAYGAARLLHVGRFAPHPIPQYEVRSRRAPLA